MKLSKLSAAFLGGSLLFCAGVFAGPTNKKTIHLYESITIAGKQLPPGDYKIEWTESGSSVQLNILNGKDVVATLPAKVVTVSNSYAKDGYETQAARDGSKTLKQVFFAGKNYDLQIQQADNTTPATSTSGNN
jgi:hypothetical protein